MIKKTINFSEFCDSFGDTYKGNFTYEGKRALFDYLENLSEDMGEDIELDIVALCVEYTEFDNLEDIQAQYPNVKDVENLNDHTTVIEVDNGHIIIADY